MKAGWLFWEQAGMILKKKCLPHSRMGASSHTSSQNIFTCKWKILVERLVSVCIVLHSARVFSPRPPRCSPYEWESHSYYVHRFSGAWLKTGKPDCNLLAEVSFASISRELQQKGPNVFAYALFKRPNLSLCRICYSSFNWGGTILNRGLSECWCTLTEPDLGTHLSLTLHGLSCFRRLSESRSSTKCAKYNLGKYVLNNQNWGWENHWEPCEVSVVECGTWHRYSVPAHRAARQLVGRQTSTL